mgnify:CR=1 FL=1
MVKIKSKIIYIKFNITELQRIIDNNLSNAIKYSFAKSPILVKLAYLNDEEIEFSVSTNSKRIEYKNKIQYKYFIFL